MSGEPPARWRRGNVDGTDQGIFLHPPLTTRESDNSINSLPLDTSHALGGHLIANLQFFRSRPVSTAAIASGYGN